MSRPDRAELRDETVAAPAAGEVRVRALLRRAQPRHRAAGLARAACRQSEYERMRAPFMGGAFPFPVKYGYATVGRIEEGPPSLRDRAGVRAPSAPEPFSRCRRTRSCAVPDGVPPARAVLAANMETALNAVWDGAPGPADRIAVVGGGRRRRCWSRGCARGCRAPQVTLVDIAPARAELAQALGAGFACAGRGADRLRPGLPRQRARPRGLRRRCGCAGDEATVVELSWYGAGDVAAPLGGAFHSRRLRLVSSQVGKVAPSHRPRWTHRTPARGRARAARRSGARRAAGAGGRPSRDLPARLPAILVPTATRAAR